MQVKVSMLNQFLKYPTPEEEKEIMIRYIHFGELNRFSQNQVFLEIIKFSLSNSTISDYSEHNTSFDQNKNSLFRLQTDNRLVIFHIYL